MKTLDTLTAALGRPQALRTLSSGGDVLAAVGRWRHSGARVDLSDADGVQLVFNVSGGQAVELRCGEHSHHSVIRAGSTGVVSGIAPGGVPPSPTRVLVTGRADTVQIVISRKLIAAAGHCVDHGDHGDRATAVPTRFTISEPCLRAAAAQALVALASGPANSHASLDAIVRHVARWFAHAGAPPTPGPVRGGLSPAARRRTLALIDQRIRPDSCSPLSLDELAEAAALSVHHFVKAFRQSEGRTPYATVIARRLDVALSLLLTPRARIDQVADRTGFSSPSHFVSAFRKHLGVTPGALRDAAGD